ncbi:MAG TPA: SigE family RNA polymerase sigma factor [Nocardioidaceae bacterium]|nr:SigE family RNA polymerase sigma factor [Nocardioidaceae bacterium]
MVTGDEASFTAWATARQHALMRTAYLLTGDWQRAEDLLQDALTKVALRWSRLESGQPEAYARTILTRDNISWWRRRGREVVVEAPPEPPASNDAVASERRMLVTEALSHLTAKQRAIVVLRFYEDLSVPQTAQTLGISEGTVKSQTHAALARMREQAPELAELLGEVGR